MIVIGFDLCLCKLFRCWQATLSILIEASAATYEEIIFTLLILSIEAISLAHEAVFSPLICWLLSTTPLSKNIFTESKRFGKSLKESHLSVVTLIFRKKFDTVEFSIQFLKMEHSKLLVNFILIVSVLISFIWLLFVEKNTYFATARIVSTCGTVFVKEICSRRSCIHSQKKLSS